MMLNTLKMNEIKFKSLDGMGIYGHLSVPKQCKSFPALLLVSGGIHGGVKQKDGKYDPLQIEICKYLNDGGYITFIVDKRGSKGYGEEYQSQLELCGREVEDIIAGGNYLRSLDYVVDGNIGIHAISRSSTTVALALSRCSIFNAAILASGFYDIYKQYKFEEVNRPTIFPTKQSMQNKDIKEFPYKERSPINFIDDINCPILLLHGRDDPIVPYESSIEFFNKLRGKGKQVELILYNNFMHFKRYSYPSHPIGRKIWDDCITFLNKNVTK